MFFDTLFNEPLGGTDQIVEYSIQLPAAVIAAPQLSELSQRILIVLMKMQNPRISCNRTVIGARVRTRAVWK